MDILIIGFIALVIVAVMLMAWVVSTMLMSEYVDKGAEKEDDERTED